MSGSTVVLLRRLVLGLVVLGLLAVAADVGARQITQQRVAAQLQADRGLPERPSIDIGGLSFLAQAAQGDFDDVTVETGPVPQPAGLALSSVAAHLSGVRVGLSDALAGRVTTLPVHDVRAQAVVSYPTLVQAISAELPSQVTGLRLAGSPSGQLALHAGYGGLGVPVELDAAAVLTVADGDVVVNVPPANLTALPEPLRQAASTLLTAQIALPVLPGGLKITGVTAGSTGLVFQVVGREVQLRAR